MAKHDNQAQPRRSDNEDRETSDLIGQRKQRLEKVAKLREMGIDPYPAKANRTHKAVELVTNYEEHEGEEVTVAGRLMSKREHGHIVFGDLQEESGIIQIYIKEDELEDTNAKNGTLGFNDLNLLDVGDLVESTGIVTKTQSGEISVLSKTIRILTKAVRPLPGKNNELKDKEVIFRKRYLDMIMNPDHMNRFRKLAEITFAIRQFLNERGFIEMRTPILQSIYGGTNAKPFKTRVNALDVDFYLAVAHELYLKKLTTAGFENVYNMVGYFRNEGIDRTHNPEFQLVETMTAYKDYEYNMTLMEDMFRYIGEKVFGKTVFRIKGHDIDFARPWRRIMMIDAVKEYTGYDFNDVKTLERAHQILDEIKFEGDKAHSIGESMVQVFEKQVEEQLIQPTIVYGHPVEISPLAKKMSKDPRFVERFEMFLAGVETGDNWTELNDPVELYERFKEQVERGRGGDDEFHPMDIDFIEAMEYGMPPTTGIGPGVERLAMMYLETEYIDDVLFFPLMKPAPVSELQKEIYDEEFLEDTANENLEITEPEGTSGLPSIEKALQVLEERVDDKYHILHAKMIAAGMYAYSQQFNGDPQLWYITGLLHDLDYTKHPDSHPFTELEWFKEWGYPESLIHAVAAHDHLNTKVEPQSTLAKALLAVDEMAGILYAYAIMRPDKFKDMKVKSVIKKYNDSKFAPKIDRSEIETGLRLIRTKLKDHIEILINTYAQMQEFGGNENFADKVSKAKSTNRSGTNLNEVQEMKIAQISDEVVEKHPGTKFGYIVLENLSVEKTNSDLEKLKKQVNTSIKNKFNSASDVKNSENIESFRQLYKDFGADPNSTLNSAEALMRRIAQGKGLYNINTVVDTYNVTSAEYEIPMAAYDLDHVNGTLTLRLTKEGDQITRIGDDQPTDVKANTLAYTDESGVVCMNFNYRDSDRTKITNNTDRIIVFVDGTNTISKDYIKRVLGVVGGRLEQFTGGNVTGVGYSWS